LDVIDFFVYFVCSNHQLHLFMKTIILFIACSLLLSRLASQDIPNAGFENWVDVGNYQNPEFWDTANMSVFFNSVITTSKTEDSHSGSFAAKMETKDFITFTIPGLVTLGDFEIDIWNMETSITEGTPFNLRPDKLNLYYKYNPAAGDKMRIGMWLLRDDGTDIPDTVATALYESTAMVQNYTLLSLDIDYRSNETPEILNIIAVSSNPENPTAGSVLIIDDLEFEFTSSPLYGDANCDGMVNIQDVITIVNFIMGSNPQPFCFENADVNSDGFINVTDVVGTVNIILGGSRP
jgi:hypothetical protein